VRIRPRWKVADHGEGVPKEFRVASENRVWRLCSTAGVFASRVKDCYSNNIVGYSIDGS